MLHKTVIHSVSFFLIVLHVQLPPFLPLYPPPPPTVNPPLWLHAKKMKGDHQLTPFIQFYSCYLFSLIAWLKNHTNNQNLFFSFYYLCICELVHYFGALLLMLLQISFYFIQVYACTHFCRLYNFNLNF